jgi:Ca-activated chloride channel family protein
MTPALPRNDHTIQNVGALNVGARASRPQVTTASSRHVPNNRDVGPRASRPPLTSAMFRDGRKNRRVGARASRPQLSRRAMRIPCFHRYLFVVCATRRHSRSSPKASQPFHLICVAVALAMAWTSPFAAAEPAPHELVSEANEALNAGNYGQALQGYEQAAEIEPEAPEIAYDQGIAYYRMGDYEKAAEYFRRALAAEDASLDAKARFNLGNCAYATALQQQQSDAQAAVTKLEEATNRYREALEITPNDLDARANIERAQRLKEILLEQMQQQQQQRQNQEQQNEQQEQQEQQSQQQDQQDGEDQQPQQSQSEEQQDQQEDQRQAEQQQGEDEQQQPQPQQGDEQQQEQQQMQQQDENAQPPQGEPKAMSREEAERLLQMIRDQERQRREAQMQRQRAKQAPVQKDW